MRRAQTDLFSFASLAIFAVNRFCCSANIPCICPSLAYAQNLLFADSGCAQLVRRFAVLFPAPSFTSAIYCSVDSSPSGKPDAYGAA
jgi:hypothetical protein